MAWELKVFQGQDVVAVVHGRCEFGAEQSVHVGTAAGHVGG